MYILNPVNVHVGKARNSTAKEPLVDELVGVLQLTRIEISLIISMKQTNLGSRNLLQYVGWSQRL